MRKSWNTFLRCSVGAPCVVIHALLLTDGLNSERVCDKRVNSLRSLSFFLPRRIWGNAVASSLELASGTLIVAGLNFHFQISAFLTQHFFDVPLRLFFSPRASVLTILMRRYRCVGARNFSAIGIRLESCWLSCGPVDGNSRRNFWKKTLRTSRMLEGKLISPYNVVRKIHFWHSSQPNASYIPRTAFSPTARIFLSTFSIAFSAQSIEGDFIFDAFVSPTNSRQKFEQFCFRSKRENLMLFLDGVSRMFLKDFVWWCRVIHEKIKWQSEWRYHNILAQLLSNNQIAPKQMSYMLSCVLTGRLLLHLLQW